VGLYVYDEKDNVLNLGPFQGSPACVQIKPGKGVVGTCYAAKKPMYIDDVKKFPGYICCDSKVRSEAVFPLVYNDQIIAVFDIDSPKIDGLKKNLEILSEIAAMISQFA
jgi:GAF domain-containing protein